MRWLWSRPVAPACRSPPSDRARISRDGRLHPSELARIKRDGRFGRVLKDGRILGLIEIDGRLVDLIEESGGGVSGEVPFGEPFRLGEFPASGDCKA